MGPAALRFFHSLARKNLTKDQGSGIITIPNRMTSESEASAMIQTINLQYTVKQWTKESWMHHK